MRQTFLWRWTSWTKSGEDKVRQELGEKGFSDNSLTSLFEMLTVKGSTVNKLALLSSRFSDTEKGSKGLRDLQEVTNLLSYYGATDDQVEFDIGLARGLSYYTGCIFEVKIQGVAIGSVSGGGRYDNLTKAFGDKDNLSGVGFSFGVDRLYDVMEALDIFPPDTQVSSKVLICHFDEQSQQYGMRILGNLRTAGISSEIYPDLVKIKKQLEYANKKLVAYTLVIGSDEIESGLLALKNMATGEQEHLTLEQIISKLQ